MSADLPGNLFVGGSLVTEAIPATTMSNILLNSGAATDLMLDYNDGGSPPQYFSTFVVQPSSIKTGSAANSMTIRDNRGMTIHSSAWDKTMFGMTNWDPVVATPAGNGATVEIDMAQEPPLLAANIETDSGNLNHSSVFLAFQSGRPQLPSSSYPPGDFGAGGSYRGPGVQCRPTGIGGLGFDCFKTKFGIAQLTPTPTVTPVPTISPTPLYSPTPTTTPTVTPTPLPTVDPNYCADNWGLPGQCGCCQDYMGLDCVQQPVEWRACSPGRQTYRWNNQHQCVLGPILECNGCEIPPGRCDYIPPSQN
jgi:hypothetical protein